MEIYIYDVCMSILHTRTTNTQKFTCPVGYVYESGKSGMVFPQP